MGETPLQNPLATFLLCTYVDRNMWWTLSGRGISMDDDIGQRSVPSERGRDAAADTEQATGKTTGEPGKW